MGLGLIQKEELNLRSSPQLTTLHLVHIALGILMPLLVLVLVGCVEEPKLDKPTVGPQAAPEDIQAAFDKALGPLKPVQMNVGDYALHVQTQAIETNSAQLVLAQGVTVTARDDLGDIIRIGQTIETVTYIGEPETVVKETSIDIAKDNLPELPPINGDSIDPAGLVSSALQTFSKTIEKVTYHSFSFKEGTVSAPAAVAEKPNCMDIPDCELTAFEIKYDLVQWYNDDSFHKVKKTYILTPDVNYLGPVYQHCQSQQIFLEEYGRDFFITDCLHLYDFELGPPTD